MPGFKGCLAVCSRPWGQQQRRTDGRTSYDDNAVHVKKMTEKWTVIEGDEGDDDDDAIMIKI